MKHVFHYIYIKLILFLSNVYLHVIQKQLKILAQEIKTLDKNYAMVLKYIFNKTCQFSGTS